MLPLKSHDLHKLIRPPQSSHTVPPTRLFPTQIITFTSQTQMSVPVWALPSEGVTIENAPLYLLQELTEWNWQRHINQIENLLIMFLNTPYSTFIIWNIAHWKQTKNQLENPGCKRSCVSYVMSRLDQHVFVYSQCPHIKKITSLWHAYYEEQSFESSTNSNNHQHTYLFWWFRRRKPFGCGWWFCRNNTYKIINYLTQR